MNRRSAMLISAGLVFALMAGTASRVLTLHAPVSATPARIVIQTTTIPQAAAAVGERE